MRPADSLLPPPPRPLPATLGAATRPLFGSDLWSGSCADPPLLALAPKEPSSSAWGAQPLLTLGVPPGGGAGSYRKLTFLCERLAWRGTPDSCAHPRRRKLNQGQPWNCTHPPRPAAAVPRAPRADPVPMAGPYFMLPSPGGKCGRAPWGRQPPAAPRQAGSKRAAGAPPAQPCAQGRRSRRTARPQPRGRPRQAHGPKTAKPRSPLPCSFSASTEKEEARKGRER